MGPKEIAREFKSLWKANDEVKADLRGFRTELVEQGKSMARIDSNIDKLANSMMLIPPRDKYIEHEMRLKMIEESLSDLEGRKQCEGCKSEASIISLKDNGKDSETRLRAIEQRMWMAVGALAATQAGTFVWMKLAHG